MVRITFAVLVATVAVLLAASVALGGGRAGNTAKQGYGGAGAGGVQSQVSKKSAVASVSKAKRAGTLPFTGLDLTLIALGGGGLLAAGYLVRRRGSARS